MAGMHLWMNGERIARERAKALFWHDHLNHPAIRSARANQRCACRAGTRRSGTGDAFGPETSILAAGKLQENTLILFLAYGICGL